jgi:hypothetical protein
MSKSSGSRKSRSGKWYENQTLVIAILGVTGTIIAALISVSPQIIGALQKPEPTQTAIPATATVEISPTPLPTSTETAIQITETIAPTQTETVTPSPTPIDPGIACLDRWQVISSDQSLGVPDGSGGCANVGIPGMGISTSGDELLFTKNNFRNQGLFGISTTIPAEATISMKVKLALLTQGEFWVALSNEPTPENRMMVIALQSEFGEVRVYVDQTASSAGRYLWTRLAENTNYSGGPPFTYDLVLKTSGSRANSRINFFDLPSQVVILPNYLFIGYQNKSTLGSVSMDVTVSNLSIEAGQ